MWCPFPRLLLFYVSPTSTSTAATFLTPAGHSASSVSIANCCILIGAIISLLILVLSNIPLTLCFCIVLCLPCPISAVPLLLLLLLLLLLTGGGCDDYSNYRFQRRNCQLQKHQV